jgi:hypothetical protein
MRSLFPRSSFVSRAEGIRKLGFRRWYERQLIEGHAYLVTCFLSMIMVAACVETFSLRGPGLQPLIMLGLLVGGGIVCIVSWRRYFVVLVRAEHTGEQSTCSACRTYGRFQVLEPGDPSARRESSVEVPDPRLRVCCRKCGHQWTID